jgi:hypothetical protein
MSYGTSRLLEGIKTARIWKTLLLQLKHCLALEHKLMHTKVT